MIEYRIYAHIYIYIYTYIYLFIYLFMYDIFRYNLQNICFISFNIWIKNETIFGIIYSINLFKLLKILFF